MMTTMCAILGGLPLMLGTGTGSELRQPLGYTMVGGLLLSQALTLFTTPVVYLYLDRLSNWRKQPETTPALSVGETYNSTWLSRHSGRWRSARPARQRLLIGWIALRLHNVRRLTLNYSTRQPMRDA